MLPCRGALLLLLSVVCAAPPAPFQSPPAYASSCTPGAASVTVDGAFVGELPVSALQSVLSTYAAHALLLSLCPAGAAAIALTSPLVVTPSPAGSVSISCAGFVAQSPVPPPCTFTGGRTSSLLSVSGAVSLTGLSFQNGSASAGGALAVGLHGTVLATSCAFSGNAAAVRASQVACVRDVDAQQNGGAVFLSDVTSSFASVGSLFSGNTCSGVRTAFGPVCARCLMPQRSSAAPCTLAAAGGRSLRQTTRSSATPPRRAAPSASTTADRRTL